MRPSNLNVLFINPSKKLRVVVRHLSEILASLGVKVIIMTPEEPTEKPKNVEIFVYPSFFIPKIRYTIPNFIEQIKILKEIIDRYDIKIVHVFTYFYPSVWLPVLYSRHRGIPVILTTDSFPGISWRYGSKLVDFAAKVYTKTIGRIILRKCNFVTLLHTKIVKDALKLGVSENKIVVIPNGVDSRKFNPQIDGSKVRKELGIADDEIMILNVGRLVPVKGIEYLIRLGKIIKGKNDGNLKAKIVILGDGPKQYKTKYMDTVSKDGISDIVLFPGFRENVAEFLAACDIFILLSISEGLPTAILEAAAVGVPVISKDVGGVRDILSSSKLGFIVRNKNTDQALGEILTIIKNVQRNKKELKKISKNLHKKVRRKFMWSEVVYMYLSIYGRLLTK